MKRYIIPPCPLCGGTVAEGFVVCPHDWAWMQEAMEKHASALIAWHEQRYGAELDAFIAAGKIEGMRWHALSSEALVEEVGNLARNIAEGILDDDIKVGYSRTNSALVDWAGEIPRPYHVPYIDPYNKEDWLVRHLTERMTQALLDALRDLPTEQVHAELLGAIVGKPPEDVDLEDQEERFHWQDAGAITIYNQSISEGAKTLQYMRTDPIYSEDHAPWTPHDEWDWPDTKWIDAVRILAPSLGDAIRICFLAQLHQDINWLARAQRRSGDLTYGLATIHRLLPYA